MKRTLFTDVNGRKIALVDSWITAWRHPLSSDTPGTGTVIWLSGHEVAVQESFDTVDARLATLREPSA